MQPPYADDKVFVTATFPCAGKQLDPFLTCTFECSMSIQGTLKLDKFRCAVQRETNGSCLILLCFLLLPDQPEAIEG